MYKILLFLFLVSCSKEKQDAPVDNTRTVKASVTTAPKTTGGPDYYKVGIIFDNTVKAKGTAVITFTYYSGSFQTMDFTLNFDINGNSNGYSEFTNIIGSQPATNVKLKSFTMTEGGYDVTKLN